MSDGTKIPYTGQFGETVGYDFHQKPNGSWYVTLEVSDKHMNQYGIAHGGVPLTLMDVAGGLAVYDLPLEFNRIATISMSHNFIGPVRAGKVTGIGEVEHHGKSVAYTSMRLYEGDDGGPLLATAQGSYRLLLK